VSSSRIERLTTTLGSCGVEFLRDESMAPHTTLGVGGVTPLYIRPRDSKLLVAAVTALADLDVPFRVLGAGSNVLIADGPLSFVVLALKVSAAEPEWQGDAVIAEAGTFLPTLARAAAQRGLAGLEFAIGIPGSVGGAVKMNAGACGSAMHDVLDWAESVSICDGGLKFSDERPEFSYRASNITEQQLVTRVRLKLGQADSDELLAEQAEHIATRRKTQPTSSRSAGCMFKNPNNDSAGRLIDQCGLKGLRVGALEVSPLHGNFVLNHGRARASDVRELIDTVKTQVAALTGVELHEEVVVWGSPGLLQ
jgi:UDP-N-acetylmuramate dehydrogenase